MRKKGQVWVSAVLYMALGVILISVILAVGVPAINKARDKAAITQTKEVFIKLDENIRAIYNEGPGSQRPIQIDIGRGQLDIDRNSDVISWSLNTEALISQPDAQIKEGNLIIITNSTSIKEKYTVSLSLDYTGILDLEYLGAGAFGGSKSFLIKNNGTDGALTQILITEI